MGEKAQMQTSASAPSRLPQRRSTFSHIALSSLLLHLPSYGSLLQWGASYHVAALRSLFPNPNETMQQMIRPPEHQTRRGRKGQAHDGSSEQSQTHCCPILPTPRPPRPRSPRSLSPVVLHIFDLRSATNRRYVVAQSKQKTGSVT